MNKKALPKEKFEAMKMIINTKYMDDLFLEAMAKLSYEEYLAMRDVLVEREETYPVVCFNGIEHKVYGVIEETYSIDAITGDRDSIRINDVSAECGVCQGKGDYAMAYDSEWEDAELLVEPADA